MTTTPYDKATAHLTAVLRDWRGAATRGPELSPDREAPRAVDIVRALEEFVRALQAGTAPHTPAGNPEPALTEWDRGRRAGRLELAFQLNGLLAMRGLGPEGVLSQVRDLLKQIVQAEGVVEVTFGGAAEVSR